MKVLTRYLIRTHIGPLLFAFVALTGVILVNTLAKELANLAGKGLPLRVVLEFFVLSLPANVALTLPMSVLVAVLYTFSTLASENEITALRASGLDLRRVTLPIILLAALIAGGMVWFNDRVLPAANYRWRVLMTDVAQTRPLLALREEAINPIRTSDGLTPYYLEAREIDPETGLMRDVAIYDVSNENVSRTIHADSGHMVFNPSYTDLLLTLFDGNMREVDFNDPTAFQQVAFNQQLMRLKGVSDRLQRSGESAYRTDRDMTVGMMAARIDTLRMELGTVLSTLADTGTVIAATQLVPEEELRYPRAAPDTVARGPDGTSEARAETVRYATARSESLRYQIREFQVEIQKKYSIATATLVFVLIGIPLALRFPAGGVGMVVAVSFGIFGIYYIGLIGGEKLGNEGYVAPQLSMWMTNILFGVLGLIGYLRLGYEHGTARGGGWIELPRTLFMRARAWLPRRRPAERP